MKKTKQLKVYTGYNGAEFGSVDYATLESNREGRECGNAVYIGNGDFTSGISRWEQDSVTPDGRECVIVFAVPDDLEGEEDCWDWREMADHVDVTDCDGWAA
jgi:hypothetical protein